MTFDNIINIYDFDEELRIQCFRWVGQFELLFRNAISEHLSSSLGSHPYFDTTIYKGGAQRQEALKSITDSFHKNMKDPRAKHYFDTYNPPMVPPIWTMKEIMTFGAVNLFFDKLSNSEKAAIALKFGVASHEVFCSWVSALIDLRNVCAHHDRLFNRHFQKQPKTYAHAGIPTAPRNSLKAILECLEYLLNSRGVSNQIVQTVLRLISGAPVINPNEVGY